MPEAERKIELPNGITLYPDRYSAPNLERHARNKGFDNLRVFVAEHPDGSQSYVLVDGELAVFEHTQSEAIWCRIDMMAADRDLP